jgi:hypothetical protein
MKTNKTNFVQIISESLLVMELCYQLETTFPCLCKIQLVHTYLQNIQLEIGTLLEMQQCIFSQSGGL